ncbi:acyl-coenzyme A thioesterase 8-like isoform X1 [Sycon ciliatum]|uniref:acyl-coenzyme A thioesterase 8-like isoform X1 n=1 Tax=Sycon ciliatum TaxID=27933 RepID=UPI0020A9088C
MRWRCSPLAFSPHISYSRRMISHCPTHEIAHAHNRNYCMSTATSSRIHKFVQLPKHRCLHSGHPHRPTCTMEARGLSTSARDGHDSSSNGKSLLEQLFDLEEIDENRYRGRTTWYPFGATYTYGGQAIAQSMMAAGLSLVSEHRDKIINSVHTYFVRHGTHDQDIMYEVDDVRDGKNYSTRRVDASQNGRIFCTSIISFHRHDASSPMEHQDEMPADMPQPDELYETTHLRKKYFESRGSADQLAWYRRFPDDQLHYRNILHPKDMPIDELLSVDESSGITMWQQLKQPLVSRSHLVHQCMLGYLTDLGICRSAVSRNRSLVKVPMFTSLDHTIWFHRPAMIADDDWFLYQTQSPVSAGGRGLNLGRLFSKDGVLLASTAQEGAYRASKL